MSITTSIRNWLLTKADGYVFCCRELLCYGSRDSIDKCLSRLCQAGSIERLARGIYKISSFDSSKSSHDVVTHVVSAISRTQNLPIHNNGYLSYEELCKSEYDNSYSLIDRDKIYTEYWWAGNTKNINVKGHQIRIKKVSPRKLAQNKGNVGLAISSVWALGKERLTNEVVKNIIFNLSSDEQNDLKNSLGFMPSWASDIFLKVMQDLECFKPHFQSISNTACSVIDNDITSEDHLDYKWTTGTVEGRWSGFGPYYAMFPVDFARKVITKYCPVGGVVLDPFCGRGTVPFVSMATGRYAIGCDINPVAWLYAKVKTDPYIKHQLLIKRAREIQSMVSYDDMQPENEFQQYAWSPAVLGFLNVARRELDWKNSNLDRSLMGTLLVHLHAKLGDGLSNQLRQSKAMAPDYSVRWWKSKCMQPPNIDIVNFISQRLEWRYKFGIVQPAEGIRKPQILLGDNRQLLSKYRNKQKADLILTSPPYYGVTNYRYDNWIRLWLLGEGSSLPDSDSWARHSDRSEYFKLLKETFYHCKKEQKQML